MPNLRSKTWTTTTPANVGDAQYWEDHLISDSAAAKAASSVQSVNSITPDQNGNVDIVALPAGGTAGQVLTKLSSTAGDADWEDPSGAGHTIQNENGVDMTQRDTLQFVNAEVSDDSTNDKTIVDCKGSKGDPGDAATITVGTVTTLPAGSSATVVNVGSTSAAVFDFGIPKGADGTGAVSDAYKTVKVGSTSIVAHEEDTLELIAGNNITLIPDSTSKTITIESSGGGSTINVINDLTSTSTTDALSAYQGNLLNAAVLLKANDADLKAVAKSGDYNDLTNKPTIPAAQIQSDWNQTSTSSLDFIKNKPTIPAAQIQSDWNQTSTSALDFIKNKPTQLGHNMLDNSTIISGIKGAITEGTTNDDVVSGYGVGIWSNTDTITLMTTVSQGDTEMGTWEADDTWETSGVRTGWLQHAALHGILSAADKNDYEISLVFDVAGGEAISCLAYRIDDAITSSLGGIAIKFNAPIESVTASVGVVIKHNRTKTFTVTRT